MEAEKYFNDHIQNFFGLEIFKYLNAREPVFIYNLIRVEDLNEKVLEVIPDYYKISAETYFNTFILTETFNIETFKKFLPCKAEDLKKIEDPFWIKKIQELVPEYNSAPKLSLAEEYYNKFINDNFNSDTLEFLLEKDNTFRIPNLAENTKSVSGISTIISKYNIDRKIYETYRRKLNQISSFYYNPLYYRGIMINNMKHKEFSFFELGFGKLDLSVNKKNLLETVKECGYIQYLKDNGKTPSEILKFLGISVSDDVLETISAVI